MLVWGSIEKTVMKNRTEEALEIFRKTRTYVLAALNLKSDAFVLLQLFFIRNMVKTQKASN